VKFSFTAKQKVAFPVRTMCRLLDVSPSGFYAFTSRSPSGTGMPREIQRQLAQEVFRAPGQRRTTGLAIVHRLVRSHDGAILVDSEPTKASLSVIFPALDAV
jgi:putative transposase